MCAQSIDSYMNIQLSNTEEFIDRKFTGALGQVLIRYVYLCPTPTAVLSLLVMGLRLTGGKGATTCYT